MSDKGYKRFRVDLAEWNRYVRWIEAANADEAIERAQQDFSEYGDEGFTLKDGGIECEAWEIEEPPTDPP